MSLNKGSSSKELQNIAFLLYLHITFADQMRYPVEFLRGIAWILRVYPKMILSYRRCRKVEQELREKIVFPKFNVEEILFNLEYFKMLLPYFVVFFALAYLFTILAMLMVRYFSPGLLDSPFIIFLITSLGVWTLILGGYLGTRRWINIQARSKNTETRKFIQDLINYSRKFFKENNIDAKKFQFRLRHNDYEGLKYEKISENKYIAYLDIK